jgi:adenylate cyclase
MRHDGDDDFGSPLLGSRGEGAQRRRLRIGILLVGSGYLANTVGAGLVVLLILVGIPEPSLLRPELRWVNLLALPLYVGIGFIVGHLESLWLVYRALHWTTSGRPPTAQEARATLQLPNRLVRFQFSYWATAAVLFGILYGLYDPRLVVKVSLVILAGGFVVAGVVRLLVEFGLRPVAAEALAVYQPDIRRGTLLRRGLDTWARGSGVPLLGIAIVGLMAAVEGGVTTTQLGISVAALAGIGMLCGLLLNLLSTARVAAPVRSVTGAMRRVQGGQLDTEVVVYDGTELGELQSGFNSMAVGLRERERVRALYARQVGEQVAQATIDSEPRLGGAEADVAVIFIDLVASTALAAHRPAREVVAILNRFCAVVVGEVNSRGGLVNKFEGDAVLAIFGAPAAHADPAGAALAAARAMVSRLAREVPEVAAGCGVTFGTVVAGYVGAADRFEYTVIGDPVNEAARLANAAKEDPTVPWASEPAVLGSGAESRYWRPGPVEVLRGRAEPTRMYLARRRPISAPERATVTGPDYLPTAPPR